MGWFSNNKKTDEPKVAEKPKVVLTKCPVCEQTTFKKVDYFLYEKDTDQTIKGNKVVLIEQQDCNPQVGNDTGFCSHCGGIIRGYIFCQNYGNDKDINEFTVALCNKEFIRTYLEIRNEYNSGKKEIQIKPIFDRFLEANKNVIECWNIKTYLIIAFYGFGIKFNNYDSLNELMSRYKQALAMSKLYSAYGNSTNEFNKVYKEGTEKFIKALGSYIG